MSCPICGAKQWEHGTGTMTCKRGHHVLKGKSPRVVPAWVVALPIPAAFAAGALVHYLS